MAQTRTPKVIPAKPVPAQAALVAAPHKDVLDAQKAFTGILPMFGKVQTGISDAALATQQAQEANVGARRAIMTSLALSSVAGKWSLDHAKMGIEAAIKAAATNDPKTEATLRQLASECHRAIHPAARDHVKQAFEIAERDWVAEGKEVDDAKAEAAKNNEKFQRSSVDTPLRDTFKRVYHMVVGSNGMLAAYASDDAEIAACADNPAMLADRVTGDVRRDEKRAARMIRKAVAAIEEIADEFPSSKWNVAIQFLSNIDAKTLKRFRDGEERARRVTSKPARSGRTPPAPASDAVNDAVDELTA